MYRRCMNSFLRTRRLPFSGRWTDLVSRYCSPLRNRVIIAAIPGIVAAAIISAVVFVGRPLTAYIFSIGNSIIAITLYTVALRSLRQFSGDVRNIRIRHYPEHNLKAGKGIGNIVTEFDEMSRAINRREEMLVVRARFSQFGADMGIALTESAGLAEMVKKCSEICCTYTNAVCAGIWLYEKSNDRLYLQATAGTYEGDPFPEAQLAAGEASAGRIAREMLPFATKDPARIPWFNNREFLAANNVSFFAGFSIVVEARLIGVLELYAGHPFCWDLLNTLDALADEMAMGIERKIIEEQIRNSLEEKEVLLREIHHRVKNNMQVITSLLNLQSRTIDDPKYREMFDESKNRIRAMAIVHEKLYRTEDIARIDISDYIASLANGLFMFYGVDASLVSLSINAKDIVLGIDTAIPCGLIINELLTNALKYAFPDRRKGVVSISILKDGPTGNAYTLTVKDNGTGLPEGYDFRASKSLGLLLVTSLAEHQLQGSVQVTPENGTEFCIHFEDARYRKKV